MMKIGQRIVAALLLTTIWSLAPAAPAHHAETSTMPGEPTGDSPKAPNPECPDESPGTADPIDLFTGRYHRRDVDLEINGIFPIRMERRYDSRSRYDSPLGYGWAFTYDMRVYKYGDESVVVRSMCGIRDRYIDTILGPGTNFMIEDGNLGRRGTLEADVNGEYDLTYADGRRVHFDARGLATRLANPQGNALEFSYTEQAGQPVKFPLTGTSKFLDDASKLLTVAYTYRLERIREKTVQGVYTGREVTIAYYDDGNPHTGRVQSITSNDGRSVQYFYDEDANPEAAPHIFRGNLAFVNGLEGIDQSYKYEDSNDPHNLTWFQDGQGMAPRTNSYDAEDRVISQVHGPLEPLNTTWAITYLDTVELPPSTGTYQFEDPLVPGVAVGNLASTIQSTDVGRRVVRQSLDYDATANNDAVSDYMFNQDGYAREVVDAIGNHTISLYEAARPFRDAIVLCGAADVCDLSKISCVSNVCSTTAPGEINRLIDLEHDLVGRLARRSVTLDGGETVTETWQYAEDGLNLNWIEQHEITSDALNGGRFRTEFQYYRGDTPCDGCGSTEAITNVWRIRRVSEWDVGETTPVAYEDTVLAYNADRQLSSVTPPAVSPADGLKINRAYYGAGDNRVGLLQTISLEGIGELSRTFDYDTRSLLMSVIDARSNTTAIVLDDLARASEVTQTFTDQAGSPVSQTTVFTYAGPNEGLPEGQWVPGRDLARIDIGRSSPATDDGQVTRFHRNALGFLKEVDRFDRELQTPAYLTLSRFDVDSLGNRRVSHDTIDRTQTPERERTTEFEYDVLDRLTTVVDEEDLATRFAYDAAGNRREIASTPESDPLTLFAKTTFGFDDLDRLMSVTEMLTGGDLVTGFDYDAAGNVIKVTDPKQQATEYDYSPRSQLEEVRYAEVGGGPQDAVVYTYDERGRLDSVTNARSQVLDYSYYAWGGLKEVEHVGASPSRKISYSYDLNGNIETASDSSVSTTDPLYTIAYDELDRAKEVRERYVTPRPAGTEGRVLTSDFDRFGNRKSLTVSTCGDLSCTAPSRVVEFTQSWTFGSLDRLNSTVLPNSETRGFSYYDEDSLKQITYGSLDPASARMVTDYLIYGRGPLQQVLVTANPNTTPTEPLKLAYVYDEVRRVDTLDETRMGTPFAYDYGYDDVSRLVLADYPVAPDFPSDESFAYDDAGNRDDVSPPPDSWGYDERNRILRSPQGGGEIHYAFNPDGSLCKTNPELITTGPDPCVADSAFPDEVRFEYDYTNRLAQVVNDPAVIAQYVYDPSGRRIKKTAGGGTTWFLWDGDQLLAEYDSSGEQDVRYAYAGGFAPIQVAFSDGLGGEDVYDVHADHLEAPRLLTDTSGAPVWRGNYAAFGKAELDSGNSVMNFNIRFPGQYYDEETGLHYNRNRYYDPSIGRYISADPIGQAAGTNLHTYALNNPTNWLDFLGLTTWPGSSNRISSGFGPRTAPTPGASTNHAGADVPNPVGGDVVASDSGEVVRTRQDVPGKANSVTVKHDDGTVASYSHVESNAKVGDRVTEGQPIGKTDLSGNSTGGHVHYERYMPGVGKAVDPTSHLQGADPYPGTGPPNGSKEDCP